MKRTGNSLCVRRNAQFFDENDKTPNRQNTHNSNNSVEYIPSLGVVRTIPQQQNQKKDLAPQLSTSLDDSMPITKRDKRTLGKRVDNQRHKHPPKAGFELIVEQPVSAHVGLVIEKFIVRPFSRCLHCHLLVVLRVGGLLSASEDENPNCKKPENTRENRECYSGKNVRTPRVTISELIEAVESPGSVKYQNLLILARKLGHSNMRTYQSNDGTRQKSPVPLAETSQGFRKSCKHRPHFQYDFEQQNTNSDSGKHDAEYQ